MNLKKLLFLTNSNIFIEIIDIDMFETKFN